LNSKAKFLIAGGSNTAITFALYALLVIYGVNYNLSLTITYVLGIVLGFLINRMWTFASEGNRKGETTSQSNPKSTSTQFFQYLLVYGLIFIVNFLILNMLVQVFTLNPIVSQLIGVAASTVCSYFLQRAWVFKQSV